MTPPIRVLIADDQEMIRGGGLSDRELDVVRLVAVGRTNAEIAAAPQRRPCTLGATYRRAW